MRHLQENNDKQRYFKLRIKLIHYGDLFLCHLFSYIYFECILFFVAIHLLELSHYNACHSCWTAPRIHPLYESKPLATDETERKKDRGKKWAFIASPISPRSASAYLNVISCSTWFCNFQLLVSTRLRALTTILLRNEMSTVWPSYFTLLHAYNTLRYQTTQYDSDLHVGSGNTHLQPGWICQITWKWPHPNNPSGIRTRSWDLRKHPRLCRVIHTTQTKENTQILFRIN